MENIFAQFIKEKQYLCGAMPRTLQSYKDSWKKYQKYSQTVDQQSLKTFVTGMIEDGLSPTTANIHIRSMNSFLSWLHENGFIKDHLKLKQLRTQKKTIQAYSDSELRAVLHFKPSDFYELRLYTLTCLLIDTGCRINEVLTLKTSGVDLDNQLLRIQGKGNRERIIPFSFELRKLLFLYFKQRVNKPGDYFFCATTGNKLSYRNMLRDWEALCKKLNIPYRSFHQLRHNFALSFIREGGDVFTLKRLLGHSSLTTTQIYVNLQTEDLKTAHAKTSILGRLR